MGLFSKLKKLSLGSKLKSKVKSKLPGSGLSLSSKIEGDKKPKPRTPRTGPNVPTPTVIRSRPGSPDNPITRPKLPIPRARTGLRAIGEEALRNRDNRLNRRPR